MPDRNRLVELREQASRCCAEAQLSRHGMPLLTVGELDAVLRMALEWHDIIQAERIARERIEETLAYIATKEGMNP